MGRDVRRHGVELEHRLLSAPRGSCIGFLESNHPTTVLNTLPSMTRVMSEVVPRSLKAGSDVIYILCNF